MKFAEVSQEVQVTNSATSKMDLGYVPGRRQANKVGKLTFVKCSNERVWIIRSLPFSFLCADI